jgi:hypothetical protein
MSERPDVPDEWVRRLGDVFAALPECVEERAWVGTSWRVGRATVAHVFGGEDGLFRITFRAEPAEVLAFENLGAPYFRASWGSNVVGMIIDEETDWEELAELLGDSHRIQAPSRLVASDEPEAENATS